MKRSFVVRLLAIVAMASPSAKALPFYSPDYTFNSVTGTGFKYVAGGGVTPDGRAANTIRYFESNIALNHLISAWRGETPLPTPMEDSDHLSPNASDINRHGWICGNTTPSGGGVQPQVWRPDGTRIDLPVLPSPLPDEPNAASAFDMNDAGVVVGRSTKIDEFRFSEDRPVYWTPSFEIVELANPHAPNEGWNGEARSISSNGIIAGTVYMDNYTVWRAMRWDVNSTAPVLSQTTDTGITFTQTAASRSLDDGTIVGRGIAGSTQFAILWTPDGQAIELRNLPNSTTQEAVATDINRNHRSIGKARNSLGQQVGVRWSSTGEPMALDRLPDAPSNSSDTTSDINDFDFVVGRSQVGTYERAILWTPDGDAIDMNSLVDSNEWSFFTANWITNTGWISGAGYYDPAGTLQAYKRPFSILVPSAGTYGRGDANFDETIDFNDLLIVAQNYGSSTNGSVDLGDFNLDGVVDFTDLLAIAQNYGDSITLTFDNPIFHADWNLARSMVPEPSFACIVIVGGLALSRGRR